MWDVVRAAARVRRHHHPHDALHRGSRGDGRPHRRDQQRRDHPGRGEGRADAQARQEAADAGACRAPLAALPPQVSGYRARAAKATAASSSTHTTRRASAPASRRCSRELGDAGIRFKDLNTTQSSLEEIFVSLVRNRAHELPRGPRDLPSRWRAPGARIVAEHRLAGHLDLALFRRVRRGDRLAHPGGRRRQLTAPSSCRASSCCRCSRRASSNASFGIYFPKFIGTIYELLSAPVSASRSSSAMSARRRPNRSCSGLIILATAALFVPSQDRASVLDDLVPGADGGHVQPVRLHHRHLGGQLREAASRYPLLIVTPLTFLGGSFYSINMLPPFWQNGHAVQSGGLSRQRVPLELLRDRRCAGRHQPRHDARVPG